MEKNILKEWAVCVQFTVAVFHALELHVYVLILHGDCLIDHAFDTVLSSGNFEKKWNNWVHHWNKLFDDEIN